MELNGTPEEIAAKVEKLDRRHLVRLICDLAVLEPHLSAEQIAERRHLSRATVKTLIVRGEFGPYYLGPKNGVRYRVPLSAVNEWDRRHRVDPKIPLGYRAFPDHTSQPNDRANGLTSA